MLMKISVVARALSFLLAIVAGFVAIPGFDVGLALVLLGVIAGLAMPADRMLGVGVTVLVLPAVAAALTHIPRIGTQLGDVAGNIALAAAGAMASAIAMRIFATLKEDSAGMTKSA